MPNNVQFAEFLKASEKLSMADLKNVCFMLDVDHEHIGGSTKSTLVTNLYGYLQRRKSLAEFYQAAASINPTISYDEGKLHISDEPITVPDPVFMQNQNRRALVLEALRRGEKDAIIDALIYLVENL